MTGPLHARCLLPILLGASSALAQAAAPAPAAPPLVQESQPLEPRRNQKIERTRIEDAGNRIDELRYGGQVQSITVQPKADVPQYEVQPATGTRFWNVFRF